jgi:amino acid adenylation domain-containing protein
VSDSAFSPVDFDPFADGELVDASPTTAAQREIWVAAQMGDDASLAYNESITIECKGSFDVAAMTSAIRELPGRHASLRATLSRDGRSLCVATSVDVPVPLVDLSSSPDREQRLADIVHKESSTPFDIEKGPLLRAAIVKMADDDHRVILGSHHIVCDGWSFAVLLKDLAPLYSAKRAGRTATLQEPCSFADYAREEAARDASKEEQYWLGRFEPAPDALDLPTDRARPAMRTVASERVDRPMPLELVTALKKAGAKNGASFFVTLFSAFGVLMARLSGQRDMVVGVPAAGQSATGKEMLVGHCANLLPIRARWNLDGTFGDVLKEARKLVLDAYDHQRFTLGDVLSRLKLPRDPSRLPLCSVLFNLDTGMEGAGLVFDGLDVTFRANPRVSETFELFLNAFESKGGVVLECQYSTALWDRETILSWLGAYEALLRAFVEAPDTKCDRLPVLSEVDRRRLIVDNNRTERAIPDGTVLDLFDEQAQKHPDKTAVWGPDGKISYAALASLSKGIGGALAARGIGEGDLVALSVDRSANMVAALLGIMSSGASYIPVDPEYPAERVALMVDKAKLVICDEESQEAAEAAGRDVVLLADLVKAASAHTSAPRKASAAGRAYVLYTSGSTGVPKGVEVMHKNLLNFVCSMRRDPGLGPSDVLCAVVTLSFDIAGYEMYVPLASGATIAVADRETAQDGRDLAALMKQAGATVLQATPSTYRLLKAAGFDPKGLKALVGGELFPVDLAAWLVESGATVVNCYGPTETTIWSTLHPLGSRAPSGAIPIGKPMDNTTVYIVDASGEPCAVGVFGELLIGGAGVARGYLGQPELTNERFRPDPFHDGGRVYKTGDKARFRHDGLLEFAGRNDDQVKVRGHRIEIGEIEAAMSKLSSIAEGAVGVVREAGSDARLVALVVPKPRETVTVTELRKHLRRTLPEPMIPQSLVELPALPRTPNGKIDRRALAKLGAGERRREREVVPASTEAERLLAELFMRALKAGEVGVHDNFFDLGGDSIQSMEIVVEIQNRTGIRLSPRTLLLSSLGDAAKAIEKGPNA